MHRKQMPVKNAFIIMRVMVRIEQQIEWASRDFRIEDVMVMSRIFGKLSALQFGLSLTDEL